MSIVEKLGNGANFKETFFIMFILPQRAIWRSACVTQMVSLLYKVLKVLNKYLVLVTGKNGTIFG